MKIKADLKKIAQAYGVGVGVVEDAFKKKFNPSLARCCEICGCDGQYLPMDVCKRRKITRLVRDHNHATGFIRGMLCDKCNAYLGLLECNPEAYYERWPDQSGNRIRLSKWRDWVYVYAGPIWKHLQSNTGVKYEVSERWK